MRCKFPWLASVVVLFACSKKSTLRDDCEVVGARAKQLAREDRGEELGKIVAKRCAEDGWSAEARSCMRKAGTPIHETACVQKLPKDARDKLNGELAHLGAPFEVAGAGSGSNAPVVLAVTAIEPTHGDPSGGTYVVVRGANFFVDEDLIDGDRTLRAANVYFGSAQGAVIRFQSDGEMIVQAPAGTAGDTVDVVVVFEPGGRFVLPKAFTFMTPSPGG